MNDRQMLEKILELTKQNQQGILELKDDVADLKGRVTNIEETMVRKKDLHYIEFKLLEHDREIFHLKQK
jgi:vacuolar-type H+-ATPase subunit D/Vma8